MFEQMKAFNPGDLVEYLTVDKNCKIVCLHEKWFFGGPEPKYGDWDVVYEIEMGNGEHTYVTSQYLEPL